MEQGFKVWAAGGESLWEPGSVTKKTAQGSNFVIRVTLDKGGVKEYTVSAREEDDSEHLKLRNVSGQATVNEGADVADLTSLTHLHEPAILYSLKERYANNTIYTYTGPILLAVNPFQAVSLYTEKLLAAYKVDGERRLYDPNFVETKPPHVYAIADKAFRKMTQPTTEYDQCSQSILVSGESGAGKTETCKIIMKYLAILGNAKGDAKDLGEIEQRVLKSNPILEAFGNARTVRNDNSSRFGKYIQLLFCDTNKLSGAAIKTFLLEKIRVVKQSKTERNYHIFYMLHAGAPEEDKLRWDLRPPEEYFYTNQSGCFDRRDGVKDTDLFRELIDAFSTMGFDRAAYGGCFDMVAAILALGQLHFTVIPGARDDEPQARLDDACRGPLSTAARLLGVTPDEITACLTSRQVTAGFNTHVTIFLSPEQAGNARDALSKALYAATFNWIVGQTNVHIDRPGQLLGQTWGAGGGGGLNTDQNFIGLLDIFGFEIFKHNYFEQFLINYANEVLQQQFNDFVFRQEQEEYRREQIQWTFIQFPDNKDCIQLIEKKPTGIIPTLDEQCLIGKSTDDRFARELYKKSESNSSFFLMPKMRADHAFGIKHYAGDVIYDTDGIIEKNRDTLQQEGIDLLMSSEKAFTVCLGEIEGGSSAVAGVVGGPGHNNKGSLRKSTSHRRRGTGGGGVVRRNTIGAKSLGAQFKNNLNNLVTVINQTHPHYVRCIKPNDELRPNRFDHVRIAEQLRNAGVLEVVRVARAGFPVRLGVHEFIERYALLAVRVVEAAYRRTTQDDELDQERAVCKALVSAVLESMKPGCCAPGSGGGVEFEAACREAGVQMGLTKVFFQQKAFNSIEKLRTAVVARAATAIQTFWRCASLRRKFLVRRGLLARRDGSRRARGIAACTIQRVARKFVRRVLRAKKEALAKAERETVLLAQLDELRKKMQGEIDALQGRLEEARALAKRGQCLLNRVVVVAGGAHGIGPGIASGLVKEGAKVAVVDTGASSAKGKVHGLSDVEAEESSLALLEANLGDDTSVKAALQMVARRFGGIDGLVNVAPPSLISPMGKLENGFIDGNLKAITSVFINPMLCLKHAAGLMKGTGGSVVLVSGVGDGCASANGIDGVGGVKVLTASAAAAGVRSNIRVNCVSYRGIAESGEDKPTTLALGLSGTREDVALQVAHLLSDRSRFVTGQTIVADGGRPVAVVP